MAKDSIIDMVGYDGLGVLGDQPHCCSGIAGTVPDRDLPDDGGYHVQRECDCRHLRLQMVVDGSLLGFTVPGGLGAHAVVGLGISDQKIIPRKTE
jgi:hypothetical protein